MLDYITTTLTEKETRSKFLWGGSGSVYVIGISWPRPPGEKEYKLGLRPALDIIHRTVCEFKLDHDGIKTSCAFEFDKSLRKKKYLYNKEKLSP